MTSRRTICSVGSATFTMNWEFCTWTLLQVLSFSLNVLETWCVIGSSPVRFVVNMWLSETRFFEAYLRLVTEVGHSHCMDLCAWLLLGKNQVQNMLENLTWCAGICGWPYVASVLGWDTPSLRNINWSIWTVMWFMSPLWSSGQSFWLQIQRSRVRFLALPDFLSSSGSGTGSTQPREVNWGAT